MFNSQSHGNLWLALAAAGLLTVAGCSNQATTEATGTARKAATPKSTAVAAKVAEPTKTITVPRGTTISATVGQTLASNRNHPGDSFAASLSKPVKLGGKVVIPKGAHVVGRVVSAKKRELKVTLASIEVHGKSYPLETNSVAGKNATQSKAKSNAKAQPNKDIRTVPARSQVTFRLAKPVAIPVKG